MISLTGPDSAAPGTAVIFCLSGTAGSVEVEAFIGGHSLSVQTEETNGIVKITVKTRRGDNGILTIRVSNHGTNTSASTAVF